MADPDLIAALDALIEPETRGDPESPLRWTTKSTRKIAEELTLSGHAVSHTVVAFLLRYAGYSLQATRKMLEGTQHPDRDAQFRYINAQVTAALDTGEPVISIDTKKKGSYSTGVSAGGSQAPVVNSWRRTSSLSSPHLVAVSR